MFDRYLRPLIDPPLDALAAPLARFGVGAEALTWGGLVVGLGGAAAVATGMPIVGLVTFLLNRCVDGLDGAVARRAATVSDRGGFLDIVADFLVYAAYPLGFAVADPAQNALAAATLLASFIASGATFLAFAALAPARGLSTTAHGAKSIYYLGGLAEGFETIVALTAMCAWPSAFPAIAFAFALLCTLSAIVRIGGSLRLLN